MATFANVGKLFQHVANVVNLWQLLAYVGNFWKLLTNVGKFCWFIASVGNSWKLLTTYCKSFLLTQSNLKKWRSATPPSVMYYQRQVPCLSQNKLILLVKLTYAVSPCRYIVRHKFVWETSYVNNYIGQNLNKRQFIIGKDLYLGEIRYYLFTAFLAQTCMY